MASHRSTSIASAMDDRGCDSTHLRRYAAAVGEIAASKGAGAWRRAEFDERTGATQPNTHGRQPVEVVDLLTAPRRSSRCISQPRATAPTSVFRHDEWAPDGRRSPVQRRATA